MCICRCSLLLILQLRAHGVALAQHGNRVADARRDSAFGPVTRAGIPGNSLVPCKKSYTRAPIPGVVNGHPESPLRSYY